MTFLVAGLAFGAWAQALAKAEALATWKQNHFPSSLIWRHALGSRGHQTLKDSRRIEGAVRSLPANTDREGTVWVDHPKNWIAVFRNPDLPFPVELFCQNCDLLPSSWEPVGTGWDAFDQTLELLDRAQPKANDLNRPGKAPDFHDSREIRY